MNSKFSHSTECASPVLSPEPFLGCINQKIENPFSKHTKYTVIFHKRGPDCFGTLQTNFGSGFSGVFPAGSSRPWNRELAEPKPSGAPEQGWLIYIHKPLKPQCRTCSGSRQPCTSVTCRPARSEPARREHFKLWQELPANKLKGGFGSSPKRQVFKLKHLHCFHPSCCSP